MFCGVSVTDKIEQAEGYLGAFVGNKSICDGCLSDLAKSINTFMNEAKDYTIYG
jgi:hypothetical protein